jgi:hypothetical protein
LAPACLRSRARRARATLVEERKRESATLVTLQTEREQAAAKGRQAETAAAPIRYVAELPGADTDNEWTIRWLIALMVLCCDPLAIALTAAMSARRSVRANWNWHKLGSAATTARSSINAFPSSPPISRLPAATVAMPASCERSVASSCLFLMIADCSRSRSLRARTFLRSSKSVTAGRRSSPAKFRRQMARADRRSDLRRRHPRSHRVQRPPHQSHRREPRAPEKHPRSDTRASQPLTSNRATEGCSRVSLPPSPCVREKAFRHITCEAPQNGHSRGYW